jgi:hypothetical protein
LIPGAILYGGSLALYRTDERIIANFIDLATQPLLIALEIARLSYNAMRPVIPHIANLYNICLDILWTAIVTTADFLLGRNESFVFASNNGATDVAEALNEILLWILALTRYAVMAFWDFCSFLKYVYDDLIHPLFQLVLCGNPTNCEALCGSPKCLSLDVIIIEVFRVIEDILLLIVPPIENAIRALFEHGGIYAFDNMGLMNMLLKLAAEPWLVLSLIKGLFANYIFSFIDLLWCFMIQPGECVIYQLCMEIFQWVPIPIIGIVNLQAVCKPFSGTCMCTRCWNSLLWVPCVIGRGCIGCHRHFTLFDDFGLI